jgi:hypothetical protein
VAGAVPGTAEAAAAGPAAPVGTVAVGTVAVGTVAVGTVAVGAVAVGAVAVGTIAVGTVTDDPSGLPGHAVAAHASARVRTEHHEEQNDRIMRPDVPSG